MTGSNPVGQGSSPWGRALKIDGEREPFIQYRAHRPTGGRRRRMPEISVQVRVGPLITRSRGPTATTLGSHPGNDGSIPSGTTEIMPRYAIWQSGLA